MKSPPLEFDVLCDHRNWRSLKAEGCLEKGSGVGSAGGETRMHKFPQEAGGTEAGSWGWAVYGNLLSQEGVFPG